MQVIPDATPKAPPAWPAPVYAWYVVAIFIVAYSFAICDRAILSLLVQPIKTDLGLTDAQIGLLQGLAFAICYTSFGLALGFIADRTDRRMLFSASIAVWSIATIACGLSTSFVSMFVSRIFVGLGEACLLPVAGSLIADYLPPASRARAYGLLLLGGTFGTIGGQLVGGHAIAIAALVRAFSPTSIDVLHDWQIAFLVVGAPGILVAVAFALSVREPVRRERAGLAGASLRAVFAHARLNRLAYATLLGAAALNVLCIYAQIAWVPSFLIRSYGWTPENVSLFLIPGAIAGVTSSVSVGWIMARLLARGYSDAPLIVVLGHAAITFVFGTLTFAGTGAWATGLFYVLLSLGANWSTSAALMGVAQITPNELRGQLSALYTFMTGLLSLSVGPWLVGALSDRVFPGATGLRWSLMAVFAVASAMALVLVLLGRPAFRAAVARARVWMDPN
jgi:MFS family permease